MEVLHDTSVGTGEFRAEDLVDEYGTGLYRFCRSLAYSREEAEDLFQETFLAAFAQPGKFAAADNPRAYLFGTAALIFRGWKRKYARRAKAAPTGPLTDDIPHDAGIEEDYIGREEVLEVRAAVAALPDRLRIPTILRYTVGMSVAEIAATLSVAQGTVKSRLSRAREVIKRRLTI